MGEIPGGAANPWLLRIACLLDAINLCIGRAVAWLSLLMVLAQFLVVVMRYAFGLGSIQLQESIIYMHAGLFLLLAGYALGENAHVRVDVLHERFTERTRAIVEIGGVLLFLLPLCVFVFWSSLPYVLQSWAIFETSREESGLPAVFLLKTLIPAFVVLLAVQGVANLMRILHRLRVPLDEYPARG